ncbi:MAG: winged helix-turn-helix domain-containing protein [Proteobacteria bacterium]|nr:winged helix-turn-helix domain-containing protein [Pseudomonadota bacterium]
MALEIPAVAFAVIEALTFKLQWVSVLLQILGTESVGERLAHLLVKLAETYGEPFENGMRIRFLFSHEDLAAMVGALRRWVSMAISSPQKAGVLRIHKRHLVIVDPDRLRPPQ